VKFVLGLRQVQTDLVFALCEKVQSKKNAHRNKFEVRINASIVKVSSAFIGKGGI
jgi:hypothetical protein